MRKLANLLVKHEMKQKTWES